MKKVIEVEKAEALSKEQQIQKNQKAIKFLKKLKKKPKSLDLEKLNKELPKHKRIKNIR